MSPDKAHARAVSATSGGIMVSRALGYVRDAVILGVFGAGGVTDAYLAAFMIPNLFRRFAGEGVLGASFVPIFASKERQDRVGAERFASQALCFVALILLGVSVIGAIFSPLFVSLFAAGLRRAPDTFQLASHLLSGMFPFLLMMGIYALISGVLNSRGNFAVPAVASALENISVILCALFLSPVFGQDPKERVWGLVVGVLLGGILQAALVWRALKQTGFKFSPSLEMSPELSEMLRLTIPTAAALAVFQLNSIVNQNIATFLSPGTLTILYLAYRLVELPSALFGTSVGIVTLPKAAQAATDGEFRRILERSVQICLLWMIPSALAYIFFGQAVIALLFEYGNFTREVTRQATPVLACYAIGLPFIGLARILGAVCYAGKLPRVPLRAGGASVAANVLFSILFVVILPLPYKACGIAIGGTLAAAANVVVMVYLGARANAFRGYAFDGIGRQIVTDLGCGLVFAVPLWGMNSWILGLSPALQKMGIVTAVFLSVGIYFFLLKKIAPMFNRES